MIDFQYGKGVVPDIRVPVTLESELARELFQTAGGSST